MEVKVVPWYNAAEFRRVYECVFSPELEDKNWAVDTISVWRTRCDPCLPAAIECTYLITSTLIQDALFIAHRTPIRQHAIELQYCCAINRFVNLTIGVHEKEYTNILEKPSKMWMAKQLGIPTYLVELRDQISHTLITPPLPHLRLAAEAALDYLKKSYWDIEAPRVRNHVMKRPDKTESQNVIRSYVKAKFELICDDQKFVLGEEESDEENSNDDDDDESDVLESVRVMFKSPRGQKRKIHDKSAREKRGKKKLTDEEKVRKEIEEMELAEIEEAAQERKALLEKGLKRTLKVIDKLLGKTRSLFLDVLVTDFFIPQDKDMKYFVNKETFDLFTDALDEHEDENPNSTPKKSCIPNIPRMHEVLWLPVIAELNKNDAVPLFLEKLLLSQGSRTVVGQKLVLAWVIKILKITSKTGRASLRGDYDHEIIKIFKKKAIVATWERLFMSALENPCKYTPFVIPWITQQCTIDKRILDRCMTLLAIYLGQTVNVNTMPQPERIFTVEDLKREKRLKNLNEEVEECLFKKVTDDRYANLPIGYRISAENKQKPEEEDNLEFSNEDQDFKVDYIISDSSSDEIDWDEYYSKFEQSEYSEYELFLKKYMPEINGRRSFLYKPILN